jgi:hypothetical protein
MGGKRPKKYLTKSRRIRLISEAMSFAGSIGGKARAEKLSPEERRAIAIKASKAAAKARTRKAQDQQRKAK